MPVADYCRLANADYSSPIVNNLTDIPTFRPAVLCGVVALVLTSVAHAQSGQSNHARADTATSQDCAPFELSSESHGQDDALLTRKERIAQLDKTLLEAANNYPCQSASGLGDGIGDGGASGASGGAQGAASQTGAATESTPASDIEGADNSPGAEAVAESTPVGDIQGDRPISQESADEQDNQDATANPKVAGKSGQVEPNGKLPGDIPAAENDDIIAQQFRQAAREETDPVAKAKLWNEYRRYKGLPLSEDAET